MVLPSLTAAQLLAHRLHTHHLDTPLPARSLCAAAGACGLQNSPPGAWETAAFQRVAEVSVASLHEALCHDRTLLQAWSWRGAPVVFPTRDAAVFLTALLPRPGEEPWIYTRGLRMALDLLDMEADALLPLVQRAAKCLEEETIQSKEMLDRCLADRVRPMLPADRRERWDAPSPYGSPDRQTLGGAVVSFLLRPCSFAGLVVFGVRQGTHPTVTSPARWLGSPLPAADLDAAGRELVRRFVHCYGPAAPQDLIDWLGCCPAQGRRLWDSAAGEMAPVLAEAKRRWMLAEDLDALDALPDAQTAPTLLLGPHDPYLDPRDRELLLPDKRLRRLVWKPVGNPGVVLCGGRVAGIWKSKTQRGRLQLTVTLWQPPAPGLENTIRQRAEQYAAFRLMELGGCEIRSAP